MLLRCDTASIFCTDDVKLNVDSRILGILTNTHSSWS